MTWVLVDATTLIALGTVGELGHLTGLDGEIVVPPAVHDEVTTEPARANLERFLDRHDARVSLPTTTGPSVSSPTTVASGRPPVASARP